MADELPDALQQKLQAVRDRFAAQLGERLQELAELARDFTASDRQRLTEMHQRLHSLAGACGMFGFVELGQAARAIEIEVKAALESSASPSPEWAQAFAGKVTAFAASEIAPVAVLTTVGGETSARLADSDALGQAADRAIRVRVIEDDAALANEFSHALRQFGYSVASSSTPAEAEAALRSDPPSVLVMDVAFHVDPRTGPGLLQQWRQQGMTLPPVIFVSNRGDFEVRMAAAEAGGAAFLSKPVDMPRLAECIEELLPRQDEAPARVLIIDDERLLTEHYRLVLEAAGMTVSTLNNADQVLDELASFRPEVILLDLNMPDHSGVALARMIRQQRQWVDISITYLSGETNLDRQIEALGAAGDDFLTKPISDRQLVAGVAARARRARELSRLAAKDSLTGLLKHSVIKETFVQECARMARHEDHDLSVAMVDIDHFKRVNDTWGHAAGDRVIRALSHLLRQRLRTTDSIGRYGGEEFMVVMPDCSLAHAHALLDDIRTRFAGIEFVHGSGHFSCRLSAGVASTQQIGDSVGLLAAADKALYVAKRSGRDRVCDASPDAHESFIP